MTRPDAYGMTHAPKITAEHIKQAATRLTGCLVYDLATGEVLPARYDRRAETFADLDGVELGPDDGTLVVLVHPGTAGDLIAEHGRPCDAASAVAKALRAELRVAA